MTDFSKGDVTDIIKGVEEVGKIIEQLPGDLTDCSDMQSDIAKIEKWATIFEHPITLVETLTKNILKNWTKVLSDVMQTMSDWNSDAYYNAGDDVADILVLSIGPITQAPDLEENLGLF